MQKINWNNMKFNSFTILNKSNIRDSYNRILWNIQCECGNIIQYNPSNIKLGKIKHCGCKKPIYSKYEVGSSFYKLTLIKKIDNTNKWLVSCNCGNTSTAISYDIISGRTKSCGNCKTFYNAKDWVGYKNGILTFKQIHSKNKRGQIKWEAECACGNIIYTIPSNNAKSCGCLAKQASKLRMSIIGKSSRQYSPEISIARIVWRRYKDKNLPKDLQINFDSFYEISQKTVFIAG